MTSRFKDHILGPDTHANRPSAATTPEASLYMCSTHGKVYRVTSGAWADWATLGVTTTVATDTIWDTAGDLVAATAADTASKLAIGTDAQLLTVDTSLGQKMKWATLTGTRVINAQTGTSYTLVLTDANRAAFTTMSNASASTLTVPPNSSVAFPTGSVVEGAQLGAGQVTLTPGSGVTINGTPGLKIAAQYGTFGLLKTATDTWLAYGRLSA